MKFIICKIFGHKIVGRCAEFHLADLDFSKPRHGISPRKTTATCKRCGKKLIVKE